VDREKVKVAVSVNFFLKTFHDDGDELRFAKVLELLFQWRQL